MFVSWIKKSRYEYVCPECGFSFEEKRINNPSQCPKCLALRTLTADEERKIYGRR